MGMFCSVQRALDRIIGSNYLQNQSVTDMRIFVSGFFPKLDIYVLSLTFHRSLWQNVLFSCTTHWTFLTSVELIYSILTCDDLDIDECETDNGVCSSVATCTNTVGSFLCTCLPGYSGDGFTCEGKSD